MNNQDYFRTVRLLILISIISFLCFAMMLNSGIDSWGISENLIKAYSERELNSNLTISIVIFLLFVISYIMLSIFLWWLYSLITVNIDLSSALLSITQALNEYTFVSAAVLTWAYNKNIKNVAN